jgi:hypothetical protein
VAEKWQIILHFYSTRKHYFQYLDDIIFDLFTERFILLHFVVVNVVVVAAVGGDSGVAVVSIHLIQFQLRELVNNVVNSQINVYSFCDIVDSI